nr:immunoglobulin light chain junction region [Macaca mulatta]MOV68494.1 immunoglobulin light chain junction region [Macaca mulatta]MOV69039.1 immunoglobulin light chain junction region [Macaca mulatta]MOV69086.1 immunoglobulin light chain junction region [Macaca mulatta]MOV71556.1 immunoglobulin light chain junction region [Macaca mulatta]
DYYCQSADSSSHHYIF